MLQSSLQSLKMQKLEHQLVDLSESAVRCQHIVQTRRVKMEAQGIKPMVHGMTWVPRLICPSQWLPSLFTLQGKYKAKPIVDHNLHK